MVPGGTASQDVGGTGVVQSEEVQPKQAGNNPNPRVNTGTAEMRDRSPSRQSTGGASEDGSTASMLKEVGKQISSVMGLMSKASRRSSAKGSALPVLQASENGKLSVKAATDWLRSVQQNRSAVDRLSVFIDAVVDNPCAFEADGKVIGMLDADEDMYLYHEVPGSIASSRIFKKLGRSEGVLASLLLRNVFLAAVKKASSDMALVVVEFYHNVQAVQNAEYLYYLYYLFEDWKDLLTEIRWAESLSKEMVHQSAQVLLQRFQPALARADRYMQEEACSNWHNRYMTDTCSNWHNSIG